MAYVVEKDGRILVYGILWRTLVNEVKHKSNIEELVKKEGLANGLVLKKGNNYHVGLSDVELKGKAKYYSPAAAFFDQTDNPTIFVSLIDENNYWFVATDGVAPTIDQVIPADDVYNVLPNLLNRYSNGEHDIYVSEINDAINSMNALQVAHEDSALFDKLVFDSSTRIGSLLTSKKPWFLISAIVVLGLGGYGGMKAYQMNLDRLERERLERELFESEAKSSSEFLKLRQVRIANAVIASLKNNSQTLNPYSVFSMCNKAIQELGFVRFGWQMSEVNCSLGSRRLKFEAKYKRNKAATVKPFVNSFSKNELSFEGNDIISIKSKFNVVSRTAINAIDQLPFYRPFFIDFYDYAVKNTIYDNQIKYNIGKPKLEVIRYEDPDIAVNGGVDNLANVPPELSYQKGSIQFSGNQPWLLDDVTSWLGQYNNITINSIKVKITNNGDRYAWNITGFYIVI